MAFKTVADLKASVGAMLTGKNLNNVPDLEGALQRAKNIVAIKADLPEVIAYESITLYDGVYEYASPANIFGTKIVDLAPQGVRRTDLDHVRKVDIGDFDRSKGMGGTEYRVSFVHRQGTPIFKVSQSKALGRVILDNMDSDNDWTAAGSASALTEDTTVIYDAPTSLRFSLAGASTGTLTKTINPLSIASYENVAVGFLAIRASAVTNLTSISVRVGSSDTAYDEVSNTEGFVGAWIAGEWLLVAFDFATATSTGTPDWSAIDYIQVRAAHSGAITNFWVGGFWLSLPSPHTVFYQTSAVYRASGQSPSANITDDNDEILMSEETYTMYEYEAARTVALITSRGKATELTKQFDHILENPDFGLYPKYRADNPSQELRTMGSYYD